jgi:hypothetical protein
MAGTQAKPTPLVRKTTPTAGKKQPVRRQIVVSAAISADANRLLREAAWRQMFGRVVSNNPFGPTA